ncbi:MAG: FlxA-like family protein [Lachnospiraceae bacterium]|nr:FlxA-like family protein [Lachnospiraceae bacterium]
MTIGGIGSNANAGAGTSAISMSSQQGMDSYSKSLQKQIADAQKQLQELAQNKEMDPETKMKKRQEIQKQIGDLNMQLRQHQMEERKKAQEEKRQKSEPKKSEENVTGLSQKSMEAMISADSSMKQAKVQGSTAKNMQNDANIKREEIKRDGGSTKRTSNDSKSISMKWDDVEGLEDKAQAATASQASTLAEANDKLRDVNTEREDGSDAKKEDKDNTQVAGIENENGETGAMSVAESGVVAATADETETATPVSAPVSGKPVAAIGSNVDVKV